MSAVGGGSRGEQVPQYDTHSSSSEQPRFDPRHNPIFQRGYVHGTGVSGEGWPVTAAAVATSAPAGPAAVEAPAVVAHAVQGSRAAELPGDVPEADDAFTPLDETRSNPFLRALWVIGIVLVVVPIGMYWQTISDTSQYSWSGDMPMPLEQILRQVIWAVAPAMISTGFLVLVGLVFERAFRWERARR